MAEEQKPVEVPKEEVAAPAVATETTPAVVAEPTADAVPATTTTETATETAAAADATPAPVEDKKDEEVKPVEEGTLEHKGQGANFPKYVCAAHVA